MSAEWEVCALCGVVFFPARVIPDDLPLCVECEDHDELPTKYEEPPLYDAMDNPEYGDA